MGETIARRRCAAVLAATSVVGLMVTGGAAGATTEPAGECAGTIRFGAAVSATGRYEREGTDVREGYRLWESWVNGEHGGIRVGDECYHAEVVYYDDEGDADLVADLTERLITEDHVDFLLGPYASDLTMAASAIAEQHGVIMVEGNGASEAIFDRGFENIFGLPTPGGDYTRSALEALSGAGARTIAIAYEDTAFPTSVAEGAERWADEFGMEVLASESYPEGVTDVSGIMTSFRDLDPDVFIGGGHFNDSLLFVRAADEVGFQPRAMIITVGPSIPDFVSELGDSANGVIGPTQWEREMTWQDEYFGTAEEYAQRYEEAYGHEPTYQAAQSTATALVLEIAIETAGSTDTDAVRQALLDLNIETFYGPVNFGETGMNESKPMGFIQIQDGETRLVGPTEVADAELQYPLGD